MIESYSPIKHERRTDDMLLCTWQSGLRQYDGFVTRCKKSSKLVVAATTETSAAAATTAALVLISSLDIPNSA